MHCILPAQKKLSAQSLSLLHWVGAGDGGVDNESVGLIVGEDDGTVDTVTDGSDDKVIDGSELPVIVGD